MSDADLQQVLLVSYPATVTMKIAVLTPVG